jgi:uncharacterized protein YkwD
MCSMKRTEQLYTLLAGLALMGILAIVFAQVVPGIDVRERMQSAVSTFLVQYFVNAERLEQKLAALRHNELLTEAAQRKAEHMAQHQYFAHVSPDGVTPWYWMDAVGYHYHYAGENLALNFVDSKAVSDAWMRSDGHRSNILRSAYTEIGTGMATGTYKGFDAVYIVQMYARPMPW